MFYILKEMENKSTLQISKELGRKYDSVLAFVREVQEIGERHGSLKAWLRKFSSEVYQNTICSRWFSGMSYSLFSIPILHLAIIS